MKTKKIIMACAIIGFILYNINFQKEKKTKLVKDSITLNEKVTLKKSSKEKELTYSVKNISSDVVPSKKEITNNEKPIAQLPEISDISEYSKQLIEFYNLPNEEFLKNIIDIEKTQSLIKAWKSKKGQSISNIENTNPRSLYTISIVLNLNVSDLSEKTNTDLGFSVQDMYVIKEFSTSKDFLILANHNRLNSEEITLDKIKMVYNNNPTFIKTASGQIYGLPNSHPSEKVIDGIDNEN